MLRKLIAEKKKDLQNVTQIIDELLSWSFAQRRQSEEFWGDEYERLCGVESSLIKDIAELENRSEKNN